MKFLKFLMIIDWYFLFWIWLACLNIYKKENAAAIGCLVMAKLISNSKKDYLRFTVLRNAIERGPTKLPWVK